MKRFKHFALVIAIILPITLNAQSTDSTKKIQAFPVPFHNDFRVQNKDTEYDGAIVKMLDETKRVIAQGRLSMGTSYFPVVDYVSGTRVANASYVLQITSIKTGRVKAQIVIRQ